MSGRVGRRGSSCLDSGGVSADKAKMNSDRENRISVSDNQLFFFVNQHVGVANKTQLFYFSGQTVQRAKSPSVTLSLNISKTGKERKFIFNSQQLPRQYLLYQYYATTIRT